MKKVRLVLACLITAACFSAFMFSCKKDENSSSSSSGGGNGGGGGTTPTTCTCYVLDEEGEDEFEVSLAAVAQEFGQEITSCSQLAYILEEYGIYDEADCE